MPNFYPILVRFCAYVNYMLVYDMHRERKFPMTITNLAALFLELFEPPSYIEDLTRVAISYEIYAEGSFNKFHIK